MLDGSSRVLYFQAVLIGLKGVLNGDDFGDVYMAGDTGDAALDVTDSSSVDSKHALVTGPRSEYESE